MYKKTFLLFLIVCFSGITMHLNGGIWNYTGTIKFPTEDSIAAKPYLCTVDENGRLFVISSKVDDPRAHNAVYFANPGDSVFTLFIDFDNNGDSDTSSGNIGALRGITVLKNDIIITASQPYPRTKPNTLAALYYYPNGDTTQVKKFGFGISGSGYGSFINGIDVSKDSMVITGIDFGTSFRWYNFGNTFKKSAYGSWNTPDTNNTTIFSNATEPGGPQTSGLDLIRDVALVPGADYYNKNSLFYTSRNSISSTQQTGGIAVWSGGTQVQPINYTGNRVTDFNGFLSFINFFPYGITVSSDGTLWVAGVDSTRRWVKGFKVDGINAEELYDLPSQNSQDVQSPSGAPMLAPSDVALTKNMSAAFVVDRYARVAFKFKNSTVGVQHSNQVVNNFELKQNYPNPFNPSTLISFTLSSSSHVRLSVTDILGREVKVLVDEFREAGKNVEVFNAEGLPSGIYFYTVSAQNSSITKRMTLIK